MYVQVFQLIQSVVSFCYNFEVLYFLLKNNCELRDSLAELKQQHSEELQSYKLQFEEDIKTIIENKKLQNNFDNVHDSLEKTKIHQRFSVDDGKNVQF